MIEAPANESQDDRFFGKSFLKTRLVIGVIGVLLPIVLVRGNRVVFGQSDLLPSLSGYYHSDMRNWFVFRFGNRDGKREDRTTRWRNWWRWIHRGCAIVIWGAVVASVVLAAVGSADSKAVFGAKRSRCSPLDSPGF